jgi:hypothetical protein
VRPAAKLLIFMVLCLFADALVMGAERAGNLPPAADPGRLEGHSAALVEYLRASLRAGYLYHDALLEWRLEQTFRRGNALCIGETSLHEVVHATVPGAERLWDRHVSRRFNFSNVTMIVVKPGVRPTLYTLPGEPATLRPGGPTAYTVTISTKDADFEIEHHGFDGGDIIPEKAPLHFTSYYHDLFVSSHSDATSAAAHLEALAEGCGSVQVKTYDLGR